MPMASVKRQVQIIENAYKTDSLNRSVLDSVDDKTIRRLLKDTLQPWYWVFYSPAPWLLAGITAATVGYFLLSGKQPRMQLFNGLLWSSASFAAVMIMYGIWSFADSDYQDKLGMVWVMFREDEDRITRILKKMDADESRVQKVLAYGGKASLLRKVNALDQQLKMARERINNIPIEIEREQQALAAALLGS